MSDMSITVIYHGMSLAVLYMYVVLYHYTSYNLCHSSMIDSSHLLWDYKFMSFDWTTVSSARDVCKQRLLPFTVGLQMYVISFDWTTLSSARDVCKQRLLSFTVLLWHYKCMSFDWTTVSSARDVCKHRLLPFTVALQVYVIWLDYCVVCPWCL